MSDTRMETGRPASAGLRSPATLALLTANLLPLVGVLFWGWDAFVILVLYWFETAIIGFWTIVRVATASREALGGITMQGSTNTPSPFGLALFVIAHAGIFMGVHFGFLWVLFSGEWAARIHGPFEFIQKLIIGTNMLTPLLALFVARGFVFFYPIVHARLRRWINPQRPVRPISQESPVGAIVGGFYARIIVMHVAILAGGFLSFFGSIVPLIVLIGIKIAVDLGMRFTFDVKDADKTFRALMRHDAQQRQGSSPS